MKRSRFRAHSLIALLMLAAGCAVARAAAPNHTALYWNPAEPGWGLNVTHQGDIAFVTLFLYDHDRKPRWFVASNAVRQPGTERFAGDLYRVRRPAGGREVERAGDLQIAFAADGRADLTYRIDGIAVSRAVQPQLFAAQSAPVCRMVYGSRAGAANYQDLWWNPRDPGWGIHLAHQADTIFATLFTYAADGSPQWLVMSGGTRMADGSFEGELYRVSGTPFDAPSFEPIGPGSIAKAGTARLRFTDGEHGSLETVVDGVPSSAPIERQVFSDPAADCGGAGSFRPFDDGTTYSVAADGSLAAANEQAARTQSGIVVSGTRYDYESVAGHITTSPPPGGGPSASMFYVAYTVKGQDPRSRPLIFFYNGGPGRSSSELHIAAFGPVRLETNSPSIDLHGAFPLVPNEETLLDVADLVFIDAVGTGYSEAVAPSRNRDFWSVDSDAEVFRDFIRRYVEVNSRGDSPRFLFGESYGAIRNSAVALRLQRAGLPLAGVIYQSPILDYNSNCGSAPVSCAWFLPNYAAISAWHQRLPSPPADLDGLLSQAEAFAATRYDPAVSAFIQQGTPPPVDVVSGLVELTGIPRETWTARFNLDPIAYASALVGGVTLARFDGRLAASADVDGPLATAIGPLLDTLGYTAQSDYVYRGIAAFGTWDLRHDGRARPDGIPELAATMALDPGLGVLVMSGHYDLSTPFQLAERDLARLESPGRVTVRTYGGGHMTYLDYAARKRQHDDIAAFVRAHPSQP